VNTPTVGAPPPTTDPGSYPGAGATPTLPAATATTSAYP
jgi:hypothetical protein